MIKKLLLYQIFCDHCGLCGNETPVPDQFPTMIREGMLKNKTIRPNPLDVQPDQVSWKELKQIAKDLGWKIGREDLCPKCLNDHLQVIEPNKKV